MTQSATDKLIADNLWRDIDDRCANALKIAVEALRSIAESEYDAKSWFYTSSLAKSEAVMKTAFGRV